MHTWPARVSAFLLRRKHESKWLAVLLLAVLPLGCQKTESRVVLYCAQDEEFARLVFDDFQKRTGVTIAPHFDTEKTKSVSIYEELLREEQRPRCDVHWNNEIVSTIRLQKRGLLEPYASRSAKPYPAEARARDDTWHAFAGRARVLLVNTGKVPEAERPKSILDLEDPKWQGKVAIAKPQFGTTATEAACLFEVLGTERAKSFYRNLAKNALVFGGNKQSAEAVSSGGALVGLTDTDDALGEIRAGRPVAIVFLDRDHPATDRLGTLFIPNTVAIIRGCPHPESARKLVDFLLSPEVEKRLAESPSGQMPLNPEVKADLPAALRTDRPIKRMNVDFEKAAALWDEVQKVLADEFARP